MDLDRIGALDTDNIEMGAGDGRTHRGDERGLQPTYFETLSCQGLRNQNV